MSDFPPLSDPKFAHCVAQVQGPAIVSTDKDDWPSGSTLGILGLRLAAAKVRGSVGAGRGPNAGDPPGRGGNQQRLLRGSSIRQGRSVAELIIDQGATTPSATLTHSLAKKVVANMKAKAPGNTIALT